MPSTITTLPTPKYYNLKTTCHIHGWKNLAPFSWHATTQTLHFALMALDEAVDVSVKQVKNELVVEVTSRLKLKAGQKEFIHQAVTRALDLATETTGLYKISQSINPEYAFLVRRGAGRLLRAPSLWEDAAKTLFTTNCSWGLTKIMCNAACSPVFSQSTQQGAFPFPSAEKVARAGLVKLKEKMRVGYRAPYIKKLAQVLSKDAGAVNFDALTEHELREYFSRIQGFGPYATNHMLILCGFYNQVPVDSVVRAYIQAHYATDDYADFIASHYGPWGEYQWWGMKLEQIALRDNWLGD